MAVMDRDRWRVLGPLLDQALEMSADDRERWLVELRERTPAIAGELADLLTGEVEADRSGFLSEPLGQTLEGLELGAYTLERHLGQGGMGSVWLARRTDGRFEGLAAVKLLNFARLSAGGQARFRREGSVLARLTHPGIARLLDAGMGPNGQPYLVLEHVDGVPIDVFAREHGLPLEARVRLVLNVLGAVGHAHANLIVHRDIKPSNILVTRDGTVKLLDFGIAKLIDGGTGGVHTALTAEGSRAFTPEYAAPEQVRGDPVTTATDVYALGVLLYGLVSGRHPTAEGCRTTADELRALFEVEPARLGHGDLDNVLAQALRKDPRERYQTVGALGDDLNRYLRHQPVSARRDSLAYRTRTFMRRHRTGVLVATVVMAVLVAATAFSLSKMRDAQRQRDAAVYATKRAQAQAEVQSLLMSQVGDKPITMREILDRGRMAVDREFASDPRLLATMLVQLSSQYADLGDDKVRGALLARAESLAVATHDTAQLVEIRCTMEDNLRTRGRYDDARRTLDGAESMLARIADPRVDVICLQYEAQLDNEAGPDRRAGPAIRRAIAIRDSLGETKDMMYVGMLSTLAYALEREKRPREAIVTLRHAAAIMDSTGRGETMTRAIIQHDLAVTLSDIGETAEAEQLLHDVLERVARSDPTGRIPTQPLIHYGHTALFQGEFDSAAKYFAMLVGQAMQDHSGYWEGRGLFGLAQAQIRLGRMADGRLSSTLLRHIEAHTDLKSTDDEITDSRILDAMVAMARGDTAAAHDLVIEVLRANGYFAGARRPVFRAALVLASETSLALGMNADALRYARDAHAVANADSLAGSRSAYVGEARLFEARALLASGDTAAARTVLALAVTGLRTGAGAQHRRTLEAQTLLATLPP
jgi:serine/threonine-protein kinase